MEIKHSFRLAWLDDIKGFAMLCVVIQHAFLNPPWGRYLFLGSVPIFFVAAGFTTTSMTSEQISRKAKRLLVPYFVYAVGLGLIALGATCWKNGSGAGFGHRILLLLSGIAYGRHSVFRDGSGIGLNHFGIAPLWFLPALFLSFVLLFLFDKLPKCLQFPYTIGLLAGTILATRLQIYLPWSIDLAPIGMFLLATGRFLRKTTAPIQTGFPFVDCFVWPAWAFLARTNGFPVSFFNGQFGSHGMASLAAYVLLAVTEFVLLARLLNNTHGGKLFFVPFRALGKNSLVFLCFQLFIINACELALGNSPGSNISVGLIKSLVTIVFCLLAARLIFRLGKTVPFFKLLG